MDEYSGKRLARGLGVGRNRSDFSFRDALNYENQSVQSRNQPGCRTRPSFVKVSQIGSTDRIRSSQFAFHSASGKAIVGSSSKTYSGVSNLRKSNQEAQKFSSHMKTVPAETSTMQREATISESISSITNVQTGLPKQEDANHRRLKSFSADIPEEVASYSGSSNTRPRKQTHLQSETCNLESSLGSSVQRSIGYKNTSHFAKPISHGQVANTSRYGLKNLGYTSISSVLPSGCSSSDLTRNRRTDVKKQSLDGESLASRGKSLIRPSIGGSSGALRNPIPIPSLSTFESSSSQQLSRRFRNSLPSRDGATSVRTRRTMNGDTKTGLSQNDNSDGNSVSTSEPIGVIPQLPQSEIPISGTAPPSSIHQFPAEVPLVHRSSYNRPGSSENSHSRQIVHPEDGIRRFNINGIAEVLLALERIDQDEELSYEQLLVMETNLFLGGYRFHDQHRDMRLDIDNMSYEELLALTEKMGTVSTALTEEALSNCLKRSFYVPASPDLGIISFQDDDVKCSICQEEYVIGDDVGKLGCEHGYHAVCIHHWLRQKNWCPICKAPAVPS